jgi:tryptophanyl-tRNA synthetase
MKRVISGIKPTGEVTLGNDLGAMKRWGEMSREPGREYMFFIPDLHALNMRPEAETLRRQTRSAAAWLLAMGVDLERSVIFRQSEVPAHSELTWILNNYTTVGELNRMTQFKDRAAKLGSEGQLVGLYEYPVLMAADILLYDADEVPVGEDQKQHIELTRDIAARFNNIHGETFRIPEPVIQASGARIMDLQNPAVKMSKSDADLGGCVLMSDSAEVIRRKIMRAVTDSGSKVEAADDKPALTNLLVIASLLAGKPVPELEMEYAGKGYGDFKNDLADLALSVLLPLQGEHDRLVQNENRIIEVLAAGRETAGKLAADKMRLVREKVGLN